ncbi:MAG: hypothetical protein ABW221_19155 [Vicinamibacteria bacterium]
MSGEERRRHRAGENVADLCRACKAMRDHTVIVVDGDGRALRVMCGFCGSQHNYRGGDGSEPPALRPPSAPAPRLHPEPAAPAAHPHERTIPMATDADPRDLEALLRRVLREEGGWTPAAPAAKWRGGQLVLRPGNGTQEKVIPVDTFFHKVVMVRNKLRTLEQQVNASALPDDEKVRLQAYITGCYGSLTTFNVLFADEADQFRGASSD